MGLALGISNLESDFDQNQLKDPEFLRTRFAGICRDILTTRPTAVNLFWAVKRMQKVFERHKNDYPRLKRRMVAKAQAIDKEDVRINKKIGKNGEPLLESGDTVLTHCNAGALATAGYGTALGVIRAAVARGKKISVIADETRPYLQGARLTVWELQQDNIPVTLITDSMAGWMMKQHRVQAVMVGADRIAANGDAANKIGTYSLAILARFHRIPFYVAAPLSTVDSAVRSGKSIPIEERNKEEVIFFRNEMIARPETEVFNPAFDVTPHRLITAIITEKGILMPDFKKSIAEAKAKNDIRQ